MAQVDDHHVAQVHEGAVLDLGDVVVAHGERLHRVQRLGEGQHVHQLVSVEADLQWLEGEARPIVRVREVVAQTLSKKNNIKK